MGGDARITGRINIQPPITWGELYNQQWALGQKTDHYPDAYVKLGTTEENTPDGVMLRHTGVAIIPTGGDTSGYTLIKDVDRIVRSFGIAPDGTVRQFAGWLHLSWAGGEEIYRVIVRNGRPVDVRPQVVWPAGARNEDAAVTS